MVSFLEIQTLGRMNILVDGKPILNGDLSQRGRGMVVYLAVNSYIHSRKRLREIFSHEFENHSSFRRELSKIHKTLNHFIEITKETVAMRSEAQYSLDVRTLEQALEGLEQTQPKDLTLEFIERIKATQSLYHGEFLPGFEKDIDTVDFEIWVLGERHSVQYLVMCSHHKLISFYSLQEQYDLALRYATQLYQLNPFSCKSCFRLMWLWCKNDQRGFALDVYQQHVKHLAKEMKIEPCPELVELYNQICAGNYPSDLPEPLE